MIRSIKIFLTLAIMVLTSCSEPQEVDTVSVAVKKSEVPAAEGEVFVSVKASGEWVLSLVYDEGQEAWASLNFTTGSGERNDIILSYHENTAKAGRTLRLKAVCGTATSTCMLTQQPASSGGSDGTGDGSGDTPGVPGDGPVVEDPVAKWMELPAIKDNDGLYFFTHYQTIGGKTLRSWSFNWDTDNLVAHWVAYPLNQGTVGNGSRTDEWGLDPHLPESMQPVLYKGYSSSGSTRYDRGHQIPSADRLMRAANIQTFYGTNMTPQINSLNGAAWAKLEGQVRDWSYQMDTLYVVTGCVVEGSTSFAYDNVGKKVTVPVGYYKAILGYKKTGTIGMTATTGGYTGCAFWFDHEPYSANFMNKAMTIDELEQKVGLDFFVNLPEAIGQSLADKVESTKDDWWW